MNKQDIKKLKKILPIIENFASIFSESEIRIKFGTPAYDGKNIYLPLDRLMSGKIKDIKGFLLHECAHALLTQMHVGDKTIFEYMENLEKNPWFPFFINPIEDVRVERILTNTYIGTVPYIQGNILEVVKTIRKKVHKKLPKKKQQFKDDLDLALGMYSLPYGIILPNYSKRVIKTLRKYKNKIEKFAKLNSIIDLVDKSFPFFKTLEKEGYFQSELKRKGSGQGKGKGKKGSQGTFEMDEEVMKVLTEILLPAILKEIKKGNIAQKDNYSQQKYDEYYSITIRKSPKEIEELEYQIIRPSSDIDNYQQYEKKMGGNYIKLLTILKQLLQKSKRDTFENNQRSGSRINIRVVGRWITGSLEHDRIFERRLEPKKYNMVWSFLIDLSGSITQDKLETERHTMILFGKLLENLKIKFNIIGYYDMGGICIIIPIKKFHELLSPKVKKQIVSITSHGSTPTYPAFVYGSHLLEKRPEKDKIFVLITDGENDTGDTGRIAMREYIHKYPKILYTAIGVGDDTNVDTLKESFGQNFTLIRKINELGQALINLFKKVFRIRK